MGGKRKEVAFVSNIRVLATLPPGASLDYVEANQTIRTLADEISAISDIPNEGVVIHGQLIEQDATLEGLGFRDNDPRGICLVRLNVEETRRMPDGSIGSEVVPAQIGGLLINEYPCMVESETARLTHMQNDEIMDKGESLIPPHIYPIMGPEEGVLVHGEGLYHLTYEAQERCSSHLKTLLKNFPKGLQRATTIHDLPVKMPDFSEVTKGLKNPRQFKHAYQFQEQLHMAIQKYHHLSMYLLSQTPKSEDEMTKIEIEYNKMQNVLDHFFEPGTLERKDSGEVVLHDKVLDECCQHKDRCMPGADSNTYYVGPVRNLRASNSTTSAKVAWDCQPTDNLVVKLQGITPSTVVGDLVQCYKIVAGNARLNITHLKYAETKFDLDTLVHDMIKKPGELGLTKFYFSYVEYNTMKIPIDDLVGFIEGDEKTQTKGEGKKKKKPKKKSKAENAPGRQGTTPEVRTNSPENRGNSSEVRENSSEVRRNSSEVRGNSSADWALGKDESPEVDATTVPAEAESEDLSLLGAHGRSESATSTNVTRCESREPLPGDAKRKEERKKIIRELAIVMETARTMDERLRREENIREGEEHLASGEEHLASLLTGEIVKPEHKQEVDVKEDSSSLGEKEKKIPTDKAKEVAAFREKKLAEIEREKKVLELHQVLECKERQAEELRQSVQMMIEEKSKEMSTLICSAEQIEDSQAFRKKRISKIDEAVKDLATEMERLNNEKRETAQECDAADENIKKIEKKKKKLENFLASYSTEANTNIAKLQKEIDSLQRMLREPDEIPTVPIESEVMTKANPELLQFMERQIEAVEKELECPICLEVASQAPIFKCEEDHLICSKCRVKVRCCPQCREEYPEGPHKRYRGAERQAERLAGMYKERESLLHPQ